MLASEIGAATAQEEARALAASDEVKKLGDSSRALAGNMAEHAKNAAASTADVAKNAATATADLAKDAAASTKDAASSLAAGAKGFLRGIRGK